MRELHLSSHTKLMQVLPGHPLTDQEYTIKGSELHVRQILLVTTRGLKDRKAFRHKMCNLYTVSLPHKLLQSNNSGPKQVCKVLPCCLQCFAFKHITMWRSSPTACEAQRGQRR